MSKSGITWTDKTWSPVTGCTKKSPGCKNCYAEREVEGRWSKNPRSVFYGRPFTDVRCHEDQLLAPMKWRDSHLVFVCPRADLFHESVPFEFLDRVFAVMALAPQHTFQLLTKRPERMREYFEFHFTRSKCGRLAGDMTGRRDDAAGHGDLRVSNMQFPLPNVWLGVTVENQDAADERIPLLLQTPAAVRWVSAEPLLGAVNLRQIPVECGGMLDSLRGIDTALQCDYVGKLDWVVAGGESGRPARPMHPDWARSLRDQCAAAGVPFLFKQHGEFIGGLMVNDDQIEAARSGGWVSLDGAFHDGNDPSAFRDGDAHVYRCGTRVAGRLLDGVMHDDYPIARNPL